MYKSNERENLTNSEIIKEQVKMRNKKEVIEYKKKKKERQEKAKKDEEILAKHISITEKETKEKIEKIKDIELNKNDRISMLVEMARTQNNGINTELSKNYITQQRESQLNQSRLHQNQISLKQQSNFKKDNNLIKNSNSKLDIDINLINELKDLKSLYNSVQLENNNLEKDLNNLNSELLEKHKENEEYLEDLKEILKQDNNSIRDSIIRTSLKHLNCKTNYIGIKDSINNLSKEHNNYIIYTDNIDLRKQITTEVNKTKTTIQEIGEILSLSKNNHYTTKQTKFINSKCKYESHLNDIDEILNDYYKIK